MTYVATIWLLWLQVRKLMASSAPVPLHVPATPEAADAEQLQAQQQALLTLGCRTMALPIGRGALTLGKRACLLPIQPPQVTIICCNFHCQKDGKGFLGDKEIGSRSIHHAS